MGLEVSRI